MGQQAGETKPARRICVGLLAHVDAGKTTLSEGILYLTKSIRKLGRVDNRDAFLDTYELERKRGITIFSKQAVCELEGMTVTLMDTPGHVDFSPEMERTLQVLDYAVLVISGADGVQGHTETLWRLLRRHGIPVFVFVNKMDQPGTDEEALLAQLKQKLDENCMAFGWHTRQEDEESHQEELAMCTEAAMEEYLSQGHVSEKTTAAMIAGRQVFPCYFGSALKLEGVEALLRDLARFARMPEPFSDFGAKVFKISRDSQGNRLTHIKITGGCLRVKDELEGGEKVNQIRIYSGAKYETVSCAETGCVCAVMGPEHTRPGQGLGAESDSDLPVLEPVLTYRLEFPDGPGEAEMYRKLKLLEEEEPMLHVVWNEELKELQAQVMGDVQMEVLKSLIQERFGTQVRFDSGNIVYKETILEPAEGVGHFEPLRHYAEVHLLLEPGEPGSGLQFDTVCSEDVLDGNWQRLILTHLEEKQHRGVLMGAEITDMKITLLTGRAHLKHTEGGDFRQATYRALRQGLMETRCRLLEPYYRFRLEVPAESAGRALTDIQRMSGTFETPEAEGDRTVIEGTAPAAAMRDYQREVIAYTRGRGRLTCVLKGYEPCHNEEEVLAAAGYDPEADVQNPSGSVFCAHGAGYYVPWNQVKDHMHVESPLELSRRREQARQEAAERAEPAGKMAGGAVRRSSSFGAEEKELEEIFRRTYGEGKRRDTDRRSRSISFEPAGSVRRKKAEPETDAYLLVDGYNIIFAWEELRDMAKTNIDGARHMLMDVLCNYQGYRGGTVMVVFDAYKVEGNLGQALKYRNIHVVYTKEAETADQYIEKLAYRLGRERQVTVATSDGLEQLIIRGQGCRLLSARDFREEVEAVSREIRTEYLQKPFVRSGNYLFSHADGELAEHLERVRLGKEEDGHGRKTDKK